MEYTQEFLKRYRTYVQEQDENWDSEYQDPLTVEERMILTQLAAAKNIRKMKGYLQFFVILTVISLVIGVVIALILFA